MKHCQIRNSIAPIAGALLIALGGIVTAGWILGVESMKRILSDGPAMKANASVAFFFGGLSLLLAGFRRSKIVRWLSIAAAIPVIAIGSITLLEHLLGRPIIDELFIRDWPLTTTGYPGRPAPDTAMNFLILGGALLGIHGHRRFLDPLRFLAILTFFITLLALISHLYGANFLVTPLSTHSMALHTTIGFFIFSAGIVFAKPSVGFTSNLFRNTPGGVIAKYLCLPIIIIPVVWGKLILKGEESKLYDSHQAISLLVLSNIVTIFFVILISIRQLNRKETQRLLSEQEKSKAFLRENVALEASRNKSLFLANMNHEFRTPLNAIIGISELLENNPAEKNSRELLHTIRNSGNMLLTIINDIMDFSKMEAEKMTLGSTPFDPHESAQDSMNVVSFLVGKKPIHLLLSIDPEVPHRMEGDSVRLRQVLINLLSNAIKFTQSGSITLGVSFIRESQSVAFSVSDTGIGISSENRQKIFSSFTQLNSSLSRHSGGTGLGLSISQKIVKMMGGEISVDSTLGKGSTFRFTLPVVWTKGASAEAHPSPAPSDGITLPPLRILLVDDNSVNLKVTSLMLKRMGIEASTATNGQEAIDAVMNSTFDLVFMDIQMPVMDGMEAASIILGKQSDDAGPSIVALTANACEEDRKICLSIGMDGYLSKPVTSEKLIESIRMVQKKKARCEFTPLNKPELGKNPLTQNSEKPLFMGLS